MALQSFGNRIMKSIKLVFLLLKPRAAVTVLLFFLLGVAMGNGLSVFSYNYVFAIAAVLLSYVSANSINDIFDRKIDEVNKQFLTAKPLLDKSNNDKDLYIIFWVAVIFSLLSTILVSYNLTLVIAVSILLSYLYSVPPIRLSATPLMAPFILTIAYVFIPYWSGLLATRAIIIKDDILFILPFLFFFFGRIILKDFRDQNGDRLFGKKTFLIKYKKSATCLVSLLGIILGNILLFFLFLSRQSVIQAVSIELLICFIYFMLFCLWIAKTLKDELLAINVINILLNGILLLVASDFIFRQQHTTIFVSNIFSLGLALLFIWVLGDYYSNQQSKLRI